MTTFLRDKIQNPERRNYDFRVERAKLLLNDLQNLNFGCKSLEKSSIFKFKILRFTLIYREPINLCGPRCEGTFDDWQLYSE